jgi:hypothetical protein
MIEVKEIGEYTVKVDYENYPESPREWDNLGKMVCFHKRYSLGDKHNYKPNNNESFFEELKKDILKNEKVGVILPLYLYDHSGISISTSSFSCPWDSGQIGFIYTTREEILKNFRGKILTQKLKTSVEQILEKEVELYSKYMEGEVYSFEVLKDDERIEYCGGYYDSDECMKEGVDTVNYMIKKNVVHQEIL